MSRPGTAAELVVYDKAEECPYLAGKVARMPLRWPTQGLTPEQFDAQLAAGDRRYGGYLYRTQCPHCRACEPIRLDVTTFMPNRRQRRIWRRGQRELDVTVGPAEVDLERVALFNKHRRLRGLDSGDRNLDINAYQHFLVETCCDTLEIAYRVGEQLVSLAILDVGSNSASAVYTHFDPDYSRLSPGVFSILAQVELCRQWNVRYLYLGLYIAASPHMSYKSEYLPHERLVDGSWRLYTQ